MNLGWAWAYWLQPSWGALLSGTPSMLSRRRPPWWSHTQAGTGL